MTSTLPAITEALCGKEARRRVFEPLVADWQREWHDTQGVKRWRVALSGTGALGWSIIRCVDLAHVVRANPTTGLAATLLLFAVAAVILSLQPFQYRWWAPAAPTMLWLWPRRNLVYAVPGELAMGIVFALLPAALLAAALRWPVRRIVSAVVFALAALVIVDGWLAPMAGHARQRAFWEGFGRTPPPVSPLAYPTTAELFVLAQDGDTLVAGGAKQTLRSRLQIVLAAAGLAMIGVGIGRSRALRLLSPGPSHIVAWWVFGWVSYRLLVYWSLFFVLALDLPRTLISWLPIMILAAVGCAALSGVRRRSAPPSSGHDALPA